MSKQRRKVNVLFIGNSFTARNNLPGLFKQLASAAGQQVECQLISAGGASLRRHWNAGEARAAIERGKYDFVVLQEQSTLPVKNAQRMYESIRLFDQLIRSAGAKTVLYMTWARQHAPQTQNAITDAYVSIARELGAKIIPAGVAWQQFLKPHDRPALYDKDGSHPTLAGSYLAACVALAVILERSPVGNSAEIDGVTAEDRRLLQRAAENAIKPRASRQRP
jgi:hypothetical protein